MPTRIEPLGYALTLGTSSIQVLPQNPTRIGLIFFNPSSATIAIAPAPLAAVIGGAGSLTLAAGAVVLLPPVAWTDATANTAWNAVASAAATPFTAWEF